MSPTTSELSLTHVSDRLFVGIWSWTDIIPLPGGLTPIWTHDTTAACDIWYLYERRGWKPVNSKKNKDSELKILTMNFFFRDSFPKPMVAPDVAVERSQTEIQTHREKHFPVSEDQRHIAAVTSGLKLLKVSDWLPDCEDKLTFQCFPSVKPADDDTFDTFLTPDFTWYVRDEKGKCGEWLANDQETTPTDGVTRSDCCGSSITDYNLDIFIGLLESHPD